MRGEQAEIEAGGWRNSGMIIVVVEYGPQLTIHGVYSAETDTAHDKISIRSVHIRQGAV